MEELILQPISRISGTVELPGSKSLSNRILLLSALAGGETHIENLLQSEDTQVMVAALRQLGVPISGEPGSPDPQGSGGLTVKGCGGALPGRSGQGGTIQLHLGNAGTAMRPLTAVLSAGEGTYELSGVPRMHERPIGDLVDGLRQLGAEVNYLGQEGYPPLRINAAGLRGGTAAISGQISSQFVTALLMAAPLAREGVEIRITDQLTSVPYVKMTMGLMARFGVEVSHEDFARFHVAQGQHYRSPGRAHVEGDASSASYFLAGAAITGGQVTVRGCGSESLQGDARFADMLEKMGAQVRWEAEAIEVRGTGRPLRGIDADLSDLPDAAMTLAVAALFAQGPTTLRGIANWRVKETDRMAAVSTELEKLGARTEVGESHLTVHPPENPRSAAIATYDDHRMAMAFSLAACGPEPVTILDPGCVAKTFPTYFEVLASLSRTVDANDRSASG
jgi:3-phosphoshikimate 1-carboxyvinyltransferase